jgi:hypothetical protein
MRPYRNYFREFLDNVKNCQKEIIEMFEEFNVNEITFPKDVVCLCRKEEEYIFFDNIKTMKCNVEYKYLSVITENDEEYGLFEYEYDDILSVYDEVYSIFDKMSEGTRK